MRPVGRILLAAAIAGLVAAAVLWGAGLLWPVVQSSADRSGLHGAPAGEVRPG